MPPRAEHRAGEAAVGRLALGERGLGCAKRLFKEVRGGPGERLFPDWTPLPGWR